MTRTRPWRCSDVVTEPWSAQDWINRGKTRRSDRNKTATKSGGRSPDAPDWSIRGGTSSRGRRLLDSNIRGQVADRRPGLKTSGRNKQQGPPPPGPDQPGIGGSQTPRTGSSEEDQAAGAATARTGSSGDKWRPDTPDWIIRDGTSSRSRRPLEWNIWGQAATRRFGLDHTGWIKQQESPHPGHDNPGTSGWQTPRTGSPGAEQEGAATTPRVGSTGKCGLPPWAGLPGADHAEGGVMVSNSSSAASAGLVIAVAIALHPVNTSEASTCQLRERSAV